MKRAAIYHYTNKSTQRPKVYLDQLRALEEYAASLGFEAADIYCDKSLRRYERTEFDLFLTNSDQYEALITKDLYHVSKNTGKCFSIMQNLLGNGLRIYTIENGSFTWAEAPFEKTLLVATYTCHFGSPNEMRDVISVRNEVFKLFAEKKTNWTVIDQYYDESLRQKDSEQRQLKELIAERDKYNLLVVHNLNDVHWRTANFCKIREKLQLDIFSLQEGLLQYR